MMFTRPRSAVSLSAALAVSMCGLSATQADAALLASDTFDYSTTGTLGAQSAAGGGFSSGWTDDSGLTTASTEAVEAASLPAPIGYDPAASGGSASGLAFLAYRGLAGPAQIDLGVDQDYFISFLAERSATPTSRSYSLLLQDSSASNVAVVGNSTGGNPNVTFGGGTETQGFNNVGNGSSYLWVVKIAARAADPDQIFVQVYNEAETIDGIEPATYEVASMTDLNSSVITQLGFAIGSGATFQLDELRIGESFSDVTAVPEPASALLALGGLLLLGSRREAGRG